jgi:hypothetical protein
VETAFKRLWWQGCRRRITFFDWPCQYYRSRIAVWNVLTDPRNFDNSEYLGWQSGAALATLMEELNADGNLSVCPTRDGGHPSCPCGGFGETALPPRGDCCSRVSGGGRARPSCAVCPRPASPFVLPVPPHTIPP